MMKPHYDVLIIGGGMVGASLAAALLPIAQKLKLKIAVAERFDLPESAVNYSPSYDARSTALTYGSKASFEQMGVWARLVERLTPIKQIHVSDRGRFGVTRLTAEQQRVAALGYVVENKWLGQVLLERLQQPDAGSVELLHPASVTAIAALPGHMQLEVDYQGGNHEVTAELVVMADGGRSSLRESLGISYRSDSYQQHAIVVNVTTSQPHQGIAYERFTDTGPMALLPMPDQQGQHRSALVWTVPNDELEQVLGLSDQEFLAKLQQRFGYRAGRFSHVGERHHYPLSLVVAEEQVRSNLVVLGNAAHALHPIAGQGFNLALRGVTNLAETIIKAKAANISIGDLSMLQEFYQQRLQDQQRTIGFSDYTMKLFSNDNPLLSLGRSVGLQLLDLSPMAKTVFARSAMGLDQPAPELEKES